jgi:hypothetical protein
MDKQAKIERFKSRWGVSAEVATFYLAADEWSNAAANESFQIDRDNGKA